MTGRYGSGRCEAQRARDEALLHDDEQLQKFQQSLVEMKEVAGVSDVRFIEIVLCYVYQAWGISSVERFTRDTIDQMACFPEEKENS